MDDGGVEAGLDALMQEDRVEHLAAGRARPKETLERPSTVCTPGSPALIALIALDRLDPVAPFSSMPVESGSARGSKKRSSGFRP